MRQASGSVLLEGKVAIITGAGGDMGRAIAVRYAQEGARVVVAEIQRATAEETAAAVRDVGGEALALAVDVSKRADTERMARETVACFGRIDVLVNCAAMFGSVARKPFDEITDEEWDACMAVNLRGMWLCCRAVYPTMREQAAGQIINIASGTVFSGSPLFLHYVTSKAGVIGLSRALAREVGDHGIRVNTIAPGLTVTRGSRQHFTDEHFDALARHTALGRPEQAADLVGTFVYLASDDSAFVTGQTIVVDGGRTMW
jgi:NAD(P)-dependent dehydrogenase (short-subunit alcohol dehydrogenase family)